MAAYEKNVWSAGDPITMQLMNHIEEGIETADTIAQNAKSVNDTQNTNIQTLQGNVSDISLTFGAQFDKNHSVSSKATELTNDISSIRQTIGNSGHAFTELTREDNGLVFDSAAEQFTRHLADVYVKIDTIRTAWQTPSINDKIPGENNTELTVSSLADRITHIYNTITSVNNKTIVNANDISLINENLSAIRSNIGSGAVSVGERLDALDGGHISSINDLPSRTIKSIITEIANARISDVYHDNQDQPTTYSSLESRFSTDESKLKDVETEINNAHRTGIRDDNTNELIADTLDLRFDHIDGGNRPSRTLPDVITEIGNAHRTVTDTLNDRFNAIDDVSQSNSIIGRLSTLENNFSTSANDLDNRLDAIDGGNALSTANGTLGARVSTAETNINDLDTRLDAIEAARPSTTDPVSGETTYGTLSERFGNVEDRATQLETDVQTIANELAMVDTGAIVNNNTRVDQLETDLRTMAAELDMLDGTSIVDTNTRIDGITTEINAAHRTDVTNDTLDNRFDAVENRTTTLEETINDAITGLAATKAIADTALTKANAAAVATEVSTALDSKADVSRVAALEGKDTIVIGVPVSGSNYTNDIPNLANPSTEADYLIADDNGKYFYWRYINNNWEMISGAGGGSGSSNAEDYETYAAFEAATPEENKDYYVLQSDDIRHHYRYLPTGNPLDPFTLIEIGQVIDTNTLKTYNLTTSTDNDKNYLDLYEFDYGIENTEYGDSGARRIAHIEMVGGGGGTLTSRKFTRITPRVLTTAIGASDTRIELRYFYTTGTANESDELILSQSNKDMTETVLMTDTINSGDPANASTNWPTKVVDGETVPKELNEVEIGFGMIDVTQYCDTIGVQTFTLTARDRDNPENYTIIKWEVSVINLSISSNFTQNAIYPLDSVIRFSYIPTGDVAKTAHFEINGTEIGTTDLSAKTISEQTYNISMPAGGQGVYQLKAYLSALVGGKTINCEPVYRDLIWRDENSAAIILGSPYRGRTINVTQYDVISIPYTVSGNAISYTVQYFVDDMNNAVNELVLTNTNGGTWNYRAGTIGSHALRIKVDTQYIDITLNVAVMTTDIAQHNADLILDFNPQGLSNNSDAAKNWTNGTYHLTTSENFDWYNGGYGQDDDGEYFLIKSGTRAYLDYKMFKAGTETITTQGSTVTTTTSTVYGTGQELKIIFKTKAVRSIDATWFSNMGRYDAGVEKEVGIQLNTHQGWLKTDSADVVTEDEATTNTYLYFPYSEEDRIELDINIRKEDANAKDGNFIMSYEDGVPSKAYAYSHGQKLYHVNGSEAIMTIGSDDCDTYIYRLRIYDNELTDAQILRNFIADGKTVEECLARYNRNCIYYDSDHQEYSPYADDNFVLDPEALASKIPNVKVLMLDAPSFTLNKKSFIKDSTLRCIHADGGTLYKSRGAADNWFFENGYHAGQGTTSDKYGDAGRNLDFLFNCDTEHNPSDKVKPIPGYRSQVTTGYGTPQAQVSQVLNWKGDDGKISLTETSVPNNFFNFKVNIASSENVNNALLQKRYNDFLPYVSPASVNQHAAHSGYSNKVTIKNDMEFVPAVLFIRERGIDANNNVVTRSEFNDDKWHYYALGNLGDSKKTDYTRAYDPNDMNEFTLEISDNNTNNSQFQTGVYMVNGEPQLEQFTKDQDYEDDGVTEISGSFTARGTSGAIASMDYVYPLDTPALKAMWNAVDGNGQYTNKAHWALVNEWYDGDHSFEMRYACCGDYRDGKLVNDTTGQGNAQLATNSKVWQAFYNWVVTASNQEFVDELDQWCVRSAVEFWYAFTHYYTMMDNRAKNTFWHFAKTGIYRRVIHPLKDMLHTYTESNDAVEQTDGTYRGTFTPTEDINIDANKVYYTEYAFDMWDYDNDTALGIDNNGELIFPYGKEDSDYKTDDPSSGYVFNGAGSVFWRRLRDLCTSEISNIFTTVSEQFFSAENLIDSFDKFQECYPEALWQVDINRKYVRPFTGKSVDGSIPRTNTRFLKAMMQGRKKYQRRQWIKDQYYYFGSKYKLGNVMGDLFLLDCYTGPDDALIAELKAQGRNEEAAQYVESNWNITITPYQDMYLNASFGETPKSPVRAKAGQPVEMEGVFTDMNNSRIYIYGASRLQALEGKAIRDPQTNEIIGAEGLASLYFGNNEFLKTDKLRKLNIGTDKSTYRNANLRTLTLNPNSPILEELNIKNCSSLAGEQDVSGCNNLKVLEAEGTNYTRILLPSSSQLTTLHLPSTITDLTILSAHLLNDFYMKNKSTGLADYSSLRNLLIDNSDYSNNINWMSIASGILNNLNYVYLLNMNKSSITNISDLEVFKTKRMSMNNPSLVQLSGTIHVTGNWSQVEKDSYSGLPTSVWPELTIDTTNGTEQTKCKVIYMESGYQSNSGWVSQREIETRYISSNGTDEERIIPDIYPGYATNGFYTRPSTIASTYQFGNYIQGNYQLYSGWSLNTGDSAQPLSTSFGVDNPYRANALTSEITLYTYYKSSPHKYQVKWYLDENTVVKTVTNQDHGGGYNLESPTVKDLRTGETDYSSKLVDVTFNADNTVTYTIFDGWEKLPTNIQPSSAEAEDSIYKINAKWYTDTKPLFGNEGIFNDTTSPSLEQLLVLSRMDGNLKQTVVDSQNIVPTLKFNYTMGYDGAKTGVSVASNKHFDAQNSIGSEYVKDNGTEITPFATDNGFTMVIDYQFDDTQTFANKAAVLLGCYDKTGGNVTGFALYNNRNSNFGETGVRIGYGDMFSYDTTKSVGIGDASKRNIVVLRHPKGSSQLWIYSSSTFGTVTSSTITIPTPLDVNTSVINENAKIFLGHLRKGMDSDSNYSNETYNLVRAYGTIYWAKYWNEDLGAGECKQLAAWPHERMTAIIAAISQNKTNDYATLPSIYLTNITASNHGYVLPERFSGGNMNTVITEGWGNSAAKSICDNRIFTGLPIRLQSVLSRPNIGYKNYISTASDQFGTVTYSLGNTTSTSALVYIPSISSLSTNDSVYNEESILERTGGTEAQTSDITPYTWIGDNGTMEVYDYNSAASDSPWTLTSGNSNYHNLRFANKPITWSTSVPLRVFKIAASNTLNTSAYDAIGGEGVIQPNDILVIGTDCAYIYVSAAEYNLYSANIQPQGATNSLFNTNGNGGWLKSTPYITRSVSYNSNNSNFIYVNRRGEIVRPAESSTQPANNVNVGPLSLTYAFTI